MQFFIKLLVICAILQITFAVSIDYKGCYYDYPPGHPRTLPYPLGTTSGPEDCGLACFIAGYYFSGIQAGLCRCGNGYATNQGVASYAQGTCGAVMTSSVTEVYEIHWGYIGEFSNYASAMTYSAGTVSSVDQCINLCVTAGYPFAGLEGGSQCYCGNHFDDQSSFSNSVTSSEYLYDSDSIVASNSASSISSYLTWTLQSAYVGCYLDALNPGPAHPKDLPVAAPLTRPSIPACVNYCANHNYAYAGLQANSHCYCGNTYGLYGVAADWQCTKPCTGSPIGHAQQYCGGAMANSIYRTKGYSVAAALGKANPLHIVKREEEHQQIGRWIQKGHGCDCGQCNNLSNATLISDAFNQTYVTSYACCASTAMATCNAQCSINCQATCQGKTPYNNALCATVLNTTAPCFEYTCGNSK